MRPCVLNLEIRSGSCRKLHLHCLQLVTIEFKYKISILWKKILKPAAVNKELPKTSIFKLKKWPG